MLTKTGTSLRLLQNSIPGPNRARAQRSGARNRNRQAGKNKTKTDHDYDYEHEGNIRNFAGGSLVKFIFLQPLAKIVTPVKTGVQRYLNLREITGFRFSPE